MTQANPNQLLDNLIYFISFPTVRQFEGLQNSRTKICLSDWHFSSPQYQRTLYIQLIYSCFLVTIFPPIVWLHFLHINTHTTHNSYNFSDEGLLHLKCQLLNSLQRPIYFINSVNNTKLPFNTLPLMQHHSFFRNLPPLPAQQSSTRHEVPEKKIPLFKSVKYTWLCVITECYHRLIQVNDKRQENNI